MSVQLAARQPPVGGATCPPAEALLGANPLARSLAGLLVGAAPAAPGASDAPGWAARSADASLAALGRAGRRWRQAETDRLRAGSTIARTARGEIEYALDGAGEPVLISHGTPGGYDQGLGIGRLLGPGFRTVAVSRPGFLGTPPRTGATPEEQAAAMIDLLDALGIDRASVLGLSGGGPAAAACARLYPQRVRRLVLWQPVLAPLPFDAEELARLIVVNHALEWVLAGALRCAPWVTLPPGLRDNETRRAVQAVAVSAFPLALREAGIRNDACQFARLRPEAVAGIAAPTLLVHGTSDPLVPFAHSARAAALIPDSRLLPVAGGTHQSTLLDADAVNDIRAFLASGS